MEGERTRIGVDHVIFSIAARQHGVVGRRQLLGCGVGEGAIEGRIAKGALRPVHRGVYALAGRPLGREGHWLAAVLTCRGGAVSHWDAAELWSILPARASGEIHVSVPATRTPRTRRGLSIHRVPLERVEITTRSAVPVTTPARTLLDLASRLPRRPAHSRRTTFERDHERDGRLRDHDHAVLRFTHRQVTERPAWLAASVRRELKRRG